MANNKIDYRGPSLNYKSYPDNVSAPSSAYNSAGGGYADYDFLISELAAIAMETKDLYSTCLSKMKNYTVVIDTSDETLVKSHQMSYPDDDTPDSISFEEYIYNFSTSLATSSQYVNKYYENKVRGIYGTNTLDVAHVIRITHSEAKRIEAFLEKYTGDIDDPTEFRVLETLQDWTQHAKEIITEFRQAFSSERAIQIPGSEMDELTESRAREFQGLFQSKLNILNANISDIISQLYKDWDLVSDVYYNKVLGPSLSFNLKVARNVTQVDSQKAPTLYREAAATTAGLKSQFENAVRDQIKRNHLYYTYCDNIYKNLIQRDAYITYLIQLSNKGATIPTPFIQQLGVTPDPIKNNTSLLGTKAELPYNENATSTHSYLTDTQDPNAHPQYLLRTGDLLTGRFEIFGELQLNGQNLTPVFSAGFDGNALVRSAAIDWTNADPNELAKAVNEYMPDELRVTNARVLTGGKIEYTVQFEIENPNVQGYEFEVIEL